MNKKTLTVAEVAELLRVSQVTIYAMVREKSIPHLRIRGRILFRLDTINTWMDQLESEGVRIK